MQSGAPRTANTILAKGAPDQCAFAPGIAFTDLGTNLEEASGQATGTCGLTTAKHDVFGNPNLGTLASNGGSTRADDPADAVIQVART